MSDDKLTDDLNKDFDGTDSENNNDGDYSLDFNSDKPSLHKENGAVNSSKREDQTSGGTLNQDVPEYVDFAISDKQKSLGIICVAKEGNTIVIKIRNGGSDDD